MKHLLLILALSATLLAPVSLTTGCKATPEQVAYKSLKVTWETVHRAKMNESVLFVQGKIPLETHQKIRAAHSAYRDAMDLALRSAKYDWNAPTPEAVSSMASDLLSLIIKASNP